MVGWIWGEFVSLEEIRWRFRSSPLSRVLRMLQYSTLDASARGARDDVAKNAGGVSGHTAASDHHDWAGFTPCAAQPPPNNGCPGRECNWTCPVVARVTTTHFLLTGTVLRVNLELRSGGGSLGVELRHASNDSVVAGYSLPTDNDRLAADGTDVRVAWGAKTEMPASLVGTEVVFVFELSGAAVLYSYSVGCTFSSNATSR